MATSSTDERYCVGDDWDDFIERLQQSFVTKEWLGQDSAVKRRAHLLMVCGSRTYSLMKDLLAPEKPADKTFEDLSKLIGEHFKPASSMHMARHRFYTHWMREGQSVPDFVADLRRLASLYRQNWGSELQIPSASFEEVLNNDEVAYQWLCALRKIGFVRLKHAPTEKGQVAKLGKRIGYLRLTFYGLTWQVEDKIDANNVAYTSGDLSLHTDYPALHHPPGVQFLHCMKQAEVGGESEMVDGFHVANLLRQLNPEAFRILTSVLVDFTDTGVDYCNFSLQSKHRIIDLDHNGRVVQINFNNATRDSVFDMPVEQVHPYLSALKDFVDLMYKPENMVTFKMEAGDILTFDNWRILHGRRSYSSTNGYTRHLEGAYANWDETMSRLRCLEQALYGNK